jgi:8-oxo-dGTP diphosphatase
MSDKPHRNPTPTVDTIIQKDSQIMIVKKKNEPFKGYFALPGGFVNEGETVEEAVKREGKEETSLDIELVDILGVYSAPNRDPRGHYHVGCIYCKDFSRQRKNRSTGT